MTVFAEELKQEKKLAKLVQKPVFSHASIAKTLKSHFFNFNESD